MTQTINQKQFSTFDLGLVASLISTGFPLLDLDKSNPKKVQFLFEDSNDIQAVIKDYWLDNLQVNARTYFDNLKAVKNRIYST